MKNNQTVKIRPAKIKDLNQIVKMRAELSKYHEVFSYNNYFGMDKAAKNKKLVVAENNDQLIGFGSAYIIKKEPVYKIRDFGHIRDMYVDKTYRRQGVAGEILKVFNKWFREKNIKFIDLNVVSANKIGRNAWAKYGFREYSIRKIKILK